MKPNNLIFFILATLLISCTGLDVKHVTGDFYLVYPDYSNKNISLSYQVENGQYMGVIPCRPSDVGFNDKYLVARCKESYYILLIEHNGRIYPDQKRIGPLSENLFLEKLESIGASNIKFSIRVE